MFDLLCSASLLVAIAPLMAIIAVAVRLGSPGPVFFFQTRAGKDGNAFEIIKFRTMVAGTDAGPSLTRHADPRVTAVGRILRKWKLDELPQFVNVLHGEMSLVGPRPDLPKYLHGRTQEQRELLALRPGVTGVASLRYRNEENAFADIPEDQLDTFYMTELLPRKIRLELEYAREATGLKDLKILLRTALKLTS
jgi:lipopolysaccharide/colanic/teichoic acid biosynthesis glycosyltransferase